MAVCCGGRLISCIVVYLSCHDTLDPAAVVGHPCVDAELPALATPVAEGGDAIDVPEGE